jgi:hypothetical protein
VEVAVVLAIITIATACCAHARVVREARSRLDRDRNRRDGARTVLEEMRNHPYDEMVARYNDNPADIPMVREPRPARTVRGGRVSRPSSRGFRRHDLAADARRSLREDVSDA